MSEIFELTDTEKQELLRTKQYFPFRKVSCVKTREGKFEIFANPTMAQVNNFARKTGLANCTVWTI